ncbi:MAG: antibiotic biosynthesis monooxygenase [Desulfobulbaceae bacterium]|jgi:heme-degrading monooxygenase HmoA|nr:antibiotic biosynthesis monooxygenase [Desulfobulbaceae bacterium]
MTVKIMIRRKVTNENAVELSTLLKKLRSLTLEQPGYISGETLNRIDKTDETMVISTWRSVEDWNRWVIDPKRAEVQHHIDRLLGQETEYAMYST